MSIPRLPGGQILKLLETGIIGKREPTVREWLPVNVGKATRRQDNLGLPSPTGQD